VCSWAVFKITGAKQTLKIVSGSEFKRDDEGITIKEIDETQSQSHELIIHNLQVYHSTCIFQNSFQIRWNI
jgi:hypothetical protein